MDKMNEIYHYETTSVALEKLDKDGFTKDYNENEQDILDTPDQFKILQVYRYEGMSNPGDESTVYGIKNEKTGEKGFFVAGDSTFESNDVAKILLELEIALKKQLED